MDLHLILLFKLSIVIISIRDNVKDIPYYEEKEKEFFSEENKEESLFKAEEELTETEFNDFEKYLNNWYEEYNNFFNASLLDDMKNLENLMQTKTILQHDIELLFNWYIKGNTNF